MPKARPPTPVYQSPSKRYTLWAEIAVDARRNPGQWFLALADVPYSTARTVRVRRHPDLRNLPGGRLEGEARNRYTDDGGTERCDLFCRWIPDTEGDQ